MHTLKGLVEIFGIIWVIHQLHRVSASVIAMDVLPMGDPKIMT